MGVSKVFKVVGVGCLGLVLVVFVWFLISFEVLTGREVPGYIVSHSKVKYKYFTMSSYLVQTDEMPGADPKTFVIIKDAFHKRAKYGKDKDYVYFLGKVIEGANPSEFEVTGRHMATDGKSVFRGRDKIK